jgi:hypothetical protein
MGKKDLLKDILKYLKHGFVNNLSVLDLLFNGEIHFRLPAKPKIEHDKSDYTIILMTAAS